MTNELYKAREELLSAALEVVASRTYLNVQNPGPHDDAQQELHDDVFEDAVTAYYMARQKQHEREVIEESAARVRLRKIIRPFG